MPSLDESDTYDAGHIAALLGVHLVSQVLDEAVTIANAAQNIGWPRACVLSFFKDMKSGKLAMTSENPVEVAQGDKEIVIENKEIVSNLATSTPEKDTAAKLKLENNIIGQGDEEIDARLNELNTSTSMFINHLFDMSEVENEVSCEEVIVANVTEVAGIVNNDSSMLSIMDELFHIAFDIASGHEDFEAQEKENSKSAGESSCYSFLEDANDDHESQDVAFYIDSKEMPPDIDNKGLECGDSFAEQINLQLDEEEKLERSEVTRYENAYLSLNRDYDIDQCSDDGDPVLQDPKGLCMHDVELLTASTSDDENLSSRRESEEARKKLAAISGVSGASGKSRGSLVSRCRSQGARLLSCLRGWWRRKTPGRRKEGRAKGSIRGMCPLSPDARRRAASLLDSSQLYSSTVPHSVVWKFNTVNEAVVNSSRWKDYTFDVKPDECGEY